MPAILSVAAAVLRVSLFRAVSSPLAAAGAPLPAPPADDGWPVFTGSQRDERVSGAGSAREEEGRGRVADLPGSATLPPPTPPPPPPRAPVMEMSARTWPPVSALAEVLCRPGWRRSTASEADRRESVSPSEPSVSPSEPSVPLSDPNVPLSEPNVPLSEPSVPLSEPSVPLSEPNVPLIEPRVPLRKPNAPLSEPSASCSEP